MEKLKSANKITLATFKSFIKRNESKLYVKEKSSFDGMVDCVMPIIDAGFIKTELNNDKHKPVNGVWLVGSSRDYFSLYECNEFEGIEIYNCCGSSIIAVKKVIERSNPTEKEQKIEDFKQKNADKIERFEELAEKNREKSTQSYKSAKNIGDSIPFGQPILVGHHSEAGHRNTIKKIDNGMRKSIEHDKKADYYDNKVKNLKSSNVISSDDPEALEKLQIKLKGLEDSREFMKNANKIVRNKKMLEDDKVKTLVSMGLTEKDAKEILTPDYINRVGFAPYVFSNLGTNISSVKNRIEQLEKRSTETSKEFEINGVRCLDNTEANRLQIFFDYIPSAEVRTKLKSNGFRWSPRNKAWQSYRGLHYINRANQILKES